MSYFVKLSDCCSYIICRVAGVVTVEEGYKCAQASRELAAEHNIGLFLVDMRGAPNIEPMQESQRFVSDKMMLPDRNQGDKTAFLVTPGDTSHDVMVEASRAAGLQLRSFTRLNEAIDWLREPE